MIEAVTLRMSKPYQKERFHQFAIKVESFGYTEILKSINLASVEIDKNVYWMEHAYDNFKYHLEKIVNTGITI
jgi:hypothetical protein